MRVVAGFAPGLLPEVLDGRIDVKQIVRAEELQLGLCFRNCALLDKVVAKVGSPDGIQAVLQHFTMRWWHFHRGPSALQPLISSPSHRYSARRKRIEI